jgi:HPt (histidine-containing phosphotransfer) domain-containing protein
MPKVSRQLEGIPEMIQQLEKVFMQSCDELKEELKQLKTQKDEHKK